MLRWFFAEFESRVLTLIIAARGEWSSGFFI